MTALAAPGVDRTRCRGRLVPVVVAAAIALGACGGRSESEAPRATERPQVAERQASPKPPSDDHALRRLLERRADALQRGRPAALAATAVGGQRQRDARAARNAAGMRLRAVRLKGSRPRISGRRGWVAVSFSYGVAGVRGRWSGSQHLRARRTARGWRIASAYIRGARPPWEVARYRLVAGRHFRVLVPDGIDPEAIGLLGTLERAYELMRDRLPGNRLYRRYLVVIAADGAQARALMPGLGDVERLTAVTDMAVRTAGPAQRVTRVVSLRLIVPWPAFSALPREARVRVFAHELTHAALARRSSGRAPAWLQEAIALYVSGDRRVVAAGALLREQAPASRAGLSLGRLAHPGAIGRLDGAALSAAYAYSSAAGFYIASRFGERRLLALLAVFGSERLRGRPGRALNDAAVRRTLGVGSARLERDLREWLAAGAPAAGG